MITTNQELPERSDMGVYSEIQRVVFSPFPSFFYKVCRTNSALLFKSNFIGSGCWGLWGQIFHSALSCRKLQKHHYEAKLARTSKAGSYDLQRKSDITPLK